MPLFLFGTERPRPVYRHLEIEKLQEVYLDYYRRQRSSFGAMMRETGMKIRDLAQAYLWSGLMLVPLLALPWALARDRWLWFVLFIGLVFSVAMLASTWLFPHYAAVAAGLFFVLVVQSLRSLHAWHLGTWRVGRNITRGLAILVAISFVQVVVKMATAEKNRWFSQRAAILEKLRAEPEKSLVIVKYSPDHNPHREWVYNEADIVHAKVILARDMGPEKNRELLEYFRDRKVWVLRADAAKPESQPYSGS